MVPLALAAISVLILGSSAVATGAPIADPGGLNFTGTFNTSTLTTEGESIITCEGQNHVTGSFNAAGTGGTISFDYTNCHVVILGFTIACKTEGAPLSNTIALNNLAFDTPYATDDITKPALLITNINTTIICGNTTPFILTGNVMGTVTSPGCGGTASSATLLFIASVAVQEHMQISGTGTKFDLLTETKSSGTKKTTGLDSEITIKFDNNLTLTCK